MQTLNLPLDDGVFPRDVLICPQNVPNCAKHQHFVTLERARGTA